MAFFSIDALSASISPVVRPNDILFSFGTGSFGVAVNGVLDIGLDFDDELDALVFDAAACRALFSLSPFSPSTFTATGNPYMAGVKGSLSPSDVLFTDCHGSFGLWASAAALGLRADDNVDALATLIPEPGSLALLGSGLLGLWVRNRKSGRVSRSDLMQRHEA